MELFPGMLLFWLACGVIGYLIGGSKGQGLVGGILGLLLGPVGVVIVLLLAGNRVPCPHCRKLVDHEATKCPYCQSSLTPASALSHDREGGTKDQATLDAKAELREILSETAFRVFWLHKRRDKIYATAMMESPVGLDTVTAVDAAYEELERLGMVEEMDDVVPAFPDGPKRHRRQLTDRGRKIGA